MEHELVSMTLDSQGKVKKTLGPHLSLLLKNVSEVAHSSVVSTCPETAVWQCVSQTHFS